MTAYFDLLSHDGELAQLPPGTFYDAVEALDHDGAACILDESGNRYSLSECGCVLLKNGRPYAERWAGADRWYHQHELD